MSAALLTVAACGLLSAAPDRPAARTYEGRVTAVAGGVALTAADDTRYTLARESAGRMLFLDPAFVGRAVRLTADPPAAGRPLTIKKVQTVKAGKAFDVDYWCENCQMSYDQPGACKCCGGETVLRELPAATEKK